MIRSHHGRRSEPSVLLCRFGTDVRGRSSHSSSVIDTVTATSSAEGAAHYRIGRVGERSSGPALRRQVFSRTGSRASKQIRMPRRLLLPVFALVVVLGPASTACVAAPPPRPTPSTDLGPVMAASRYSAEELGAWFASKKITGAKLTNAEVTELARLFIEEGAVESVTGDIAFVQAVLESGWFRFSTRMPVTNNNFSGIGAVDSGDSSAAFATRREGVRAQIQHLRAYSDPTVTVAKLSRPLVDPRFTLVSPAGKAPNWSEYGNGNWATDPGYAAKLAELHNQLRAHVLAAR